MTDSFGLKPACPAPFVRAPRVQQGLGSTHQQIYLATPALRGALVALVSRDTRGAELNSSQCLTHFPASPLVTLSWFHDMDVGKVEVHPQGHIWRQFGASIVLSGSQSSPLVSWAPGTGRGYMACFPPDVAQLLFGIDLSAIHDRFVPVGELVGTEFDALWDALLAARDDAETLSALEVHLGKRWQQLQGPMSAVASLRQAGRHWVQRLAWRAYEWNRGSSPRQVERRVKAFSGRSLREWQSLTKSEELFFAARDCHESEGDIDWANLAADQNFSDQAHLIRVAKRITGFTPVEFTKRFLEDESFWLYRLWV